jgi:hypothetical protein
VQQQQRRHTVVLRLVKISVAVVGQRRLPPHAAREDR